jgi:hypothetical protein
METLVIHSESSKIKALIEILKAFNITYERKKESYNSEFVNTMDLSIQQAEKGKVKSVDINNLWK